MSDKKNFNYGRPFSPDDETEQQLQHWFTPDLTAEQAAGQAKTNALNIPTSSKKSAQADEQEEFNIKPLTATDMEQIRQAAYDEGFAEGKEEGFSKGYAEGREQGQQDGMVQGQAEGKKTGLADAEQELTAQREQLTALLSQLQQPLLAVNEQVKQQLLQLSLAMAQAVIAVEAKTNPDVILQAISDATSALPLQSKNVVIKLNPIDIAKVEQFYSAADIAKHGWQLTPAVNVSEGGCLVQSTLSSVDRSLEQRIETSLAHFIELQQLAKQDAAKNIADSPDSNVSEDLNSEGESSEGENSENQTAESAAADKNATDLEATDPEATEPAAAEQNYTAAEESHLDAPSKANSRLDKDLDEEQ